MECDPAKDSKNKRQDYPPRFPRIATRAAHNQAKEYAHHRRDEDGVTKEVNSSKSMAPAWAALIFDVENEDNGEKTKSRCRQVQPKYPSPILQRQSTANDGPNRRSNGCGRKDSTQVGATMPGRNHIADNDIGEHIKSS